MQILFFALAILCFEKKLATRVYSWFTCLRKRGRKSPSVLNEDIRRENDRFLSTPLQELFKAYPLVVKKVTKYFGKKLAIQDFTFGVGKGECFGLIGPDDSGKKTTVAMITGHMPISSGTVYVNDKKINFNSLKVFQKVGVCPSSDGLMAHMTGEEILQLYANLKGVPSRKIPLLIAHLSSVLAIDVMKQKIEQYDICYKKKLSVAIALIGNSSLIILEEPTADLDPTSCRHIWNTLIQASALGCTILLTSDRMDECEAVCNRVGIIVRGKMVYIGKLDALGDSFGTGYTVSLHLPKVRQARRAVLKRMEVPKMLFESECPEAHLKVDQALLVHYFIPENDVKWSRVFKSLEKIKYEVEGFSYSVMETNLEHIYLHKTMVPKEKNPALVPLKTN